MRVEPEYPGRDLNPHAPGAADFDPTRPREPFILGTEERLPVPIASRSVGSWRLKALSGGVAMGEVGLALRTREHPAVEIGSRGRSQAPRVEGVPRRWSRCRKTVSTPDSWPWRNCLRPDHSPKASEGRDVMTAALRNTNTPIRHADTACRRDLRPSRSGTSTSSAAYSKAKAGRRLPRPISL